MRYLLDTNTLIFAISDREQLSNDILNLLDDYSNMLYTSSICIVELLQLYRIEKISTQYKTAGEMIQAIEDDFYIEILPFTKQHTKLLSKLEIADGHNDPFDHAIISQAIAEKLNVISSDRKFEKYTPQKLLFTYNKR